jgi:hypothetical protein
MLLTTQATRAISSTFILRSSFTMHVRHSGVTHRSVVTGAIARAYLAGLARLALTPRDSGRHHSIPRESMYNLKYLKYDQPLEMLCISVSYIRSTTLRRSQCLVWKLYEVSRQIEQSVMQYAEKSI